MGEEMSIIESKEERDLTVSSSKPPRILSVSYDSDAESPKDQREVMRNKLREMFKNKGPPFIAKALSYAKKGAKLDILLYPRQSA